MQFFKKYKKTLLVAVIGIALFLFGGSFVPNFLRPSNLLNVIRQSSVIAIAAVGMSQVIVIKGIDRKGITRDVALVIADQMDINIHKLSISSDKGIFEGRIEIRVHDREELTGIIDALSSGNGL